MEAAEETGACGRTAGSRPGDHTRVGTGSASKAPQQQPTAGRTGSRQTARSAPADRPAAPRPRARAACRGPRRRTRSTRWIDAGRGHLARRGRSRRGPEAHEPRQGPLRAASADPADDQPVTKRDLVRYFARIAPTILPHLAERPLNLHRFPNGADGPGLLAEGHPRRPRRRGSAAGTRSASRSARPTTISSPTGSRPCAGSATRRRSRSTPGPPPRAAVHRRPSP